jgi:hypothetical protein
MLCRPVNTLGWYINLDLTEDPSTLVKLICGNSILVACSKGNIQLFRHDVLLTCKSTHRSELEKNCIVGIPVRTKSTNIIVHTGKNDAETIRSVTAFALL